MSDFQGYDLAAFDFDYAAVAARHRAALLDKIPPELRVPEWTQPIHKPPAADPNAPGPSFKSLLASSARAQDILRMVRTELCERAAVDLVRDMQDGRLQVEEVTSSFVAMAALAHQATAGLSDFFPEAALQRARELERLTLEERKRRLLFGLPITIKGHFHVKGTGNQRGFVSDVLSPSSALHPNLDKSRRSLLRFQGRYIADHNAQIVDILLDQGAIIIGKTTMPQSVMHLDTRSNLFGQTYNPANLALSAGGSSGGESAILGANGSAGSLGTDIGGSVRHPCGVVGLYGLRPTCTRLPVGGTRSNMPGNESVGATCGPMVRDARDVELFMRAILSAEPWRRDPACVRMPWRSGSEVAIRQKGRPIRIGVIACDQVVVPVAPVRRALEDVVARLQVAGSGRAFEFKQIDVGDRHARGWDLIRSLYFTDGGAVIKALADASGEPLLRLTQHILSDPSPTQALDANEIWYRQAQKDAFRAEYAAFFDSLDVDFVLTPVSSAPAPRPEEILYWGYTSIWNLVDYPSVTFPTGHVADAVKDVEVDARRSAQPSTPLSSWDSWQRQEYEQHRTIFDNAPICLQLVARRFHEEELLRALSEIESALKE